MNLPNSTNPDHQYAFKKGYRLAFKGKSIASMPMSMRYNFEMRQFFQQGWEQAHEEIGLALGSKPKFPWRQKAAWWLMMILAGIATAYSMITEMESFNQPLIADLKVLPLNNDSHDERSKTLEELRVGIDFKTAKPLDSILTERQRKDLQLAKKQHETLTYNNIYAKYPVKKQFEIIVENAEITPQVSNSDVVISFESLVPKQFRRISFNSYISINKDKQTIYHRWIYNKQIMQTEKFIITKPSTVLSSNIQLTSAWQGKWIIEILNEKQQTIYRKSFIYAQ